MKTRSTLCYPDGEKSCFACCPPIRPPEYEHIRFKNFIHRELVRNTIEFKNSCPSKRPITGYSCWAMGYIDDRFRVPGCLLHPYLNQGKDLRYLVDYQDKCRRESCREYHIFALLREDEKKFYIRMTDGMDSFTYSSRRLNPLFRLLNWGETVLRAIARNGNSSPISFEELFELYPFLTTSHNPRACSYIVSEVISNRGVSIMMIRGFKEELDYFMSQIIEDLRGYELNKSNGEYYYKLPFQKDLLEFIRFGLGIKKLSKEDAHRVKTLLQRKINSYF